MILVPNGAEDLCGTLTNATGWMEVFSCQGR
ncbi:hypothetical protein AYX14_07108 [Cryptococcus neoformans]|nr:hypothetical protein AYX14_07108 [Cryptococcus neoformans var. grubii]